MFSNCKPFFSRFQLPKRSSNLENELAIGLENNFVLEVNVWLENNLPQMIGSLFLVKDSRG